MVMFAPSMPVTSEIVAFLPLTIGSGIPSVDRKKERFLRERDTGECRSTEPFLQVCRTLKDRYQHQQRPDRSVQRW